MTFRQTSSACMLWTSSFISNPCCMTSVYSLNLLNSTILPSNPAALMQTGMVQILVRRWCLTDLQVFDYSMTSEGSRNCTRVLWIFLCRIWASEAISSSVNRFLKRSKNFVGDSGISTLDGLRPGPVDSVALSFAMYPSHSRFLPSRYSLMELSSFWVSTSRVWYLTIMESFSIMSLSSCRHYSLNSFSWSAFKANFSSLSSSLFLSSINWPFWFKTRSICDSSP